MGPNSKISHRWTGEHWQVQQATSEGYQTTQRGMQEVTYSNGSPLRWGTATVTDRKLRRIIFYHDITKLYTLHVKAPCEAEASCAALVKSGKVYATATEDMDGLTFGTTVLLRHLTASEAKYVWICFISEIGYVDILDIL